SGSSRNAFRSITRSRLPTHPAAADPINPSMRVAEVEIGRSRTLDRGSPVSTRIRAEETNVGALAPNRSERLGDPCLRDVALGIDGEVVTTEPYARRSGLDARQVDSADGELRQQFEQRTRMVVRDERHHGRAVGPGRGRRR